MNDFFINSRVASYDFTSDTITPEHIANALEELEINNNIIDYTLHKSKGVVTALFYLKDEVKFAHNYQYSPEEISEFTTLTNELATQEPLSVNSPIMRERVNHIHNYLEANQTDFDMYVAWLKDNNSYENIFGSFIFDNYDDAIHQLREQITNPENALAIKKDIIDSIDDQDESDLTKNVLNENSQGIIDVENFILNGEDKDDVSFILKKTEGEPTPYKIFDIVKLTDHQNASIPEYFTSNPKYKDARAKGGFAVRLYAQSTARGRKTYLWVFPEDLKNDFDMVDNISVYNTPQLAKAPKETTNNDSENNYVALEDTFERAYSTIIYKIMERPDRYFSIPDEAYQKIVPVAQAALEASGQTVDSFNFFVKKYNLKKLRELVDARASGTDLLDYIDTVDTNIKKYAPEEPETTEDTSAELSDEDKQYSQFRDLFFKNQPYEKTGKETPEEIKDLTELQKEGYSILPEFKDLKKNNPKRYKKFIKLFEKEKDDIDAVKNTDDSENTELKDLNGDKPDSQQKKDYRPKLREIPEKLKKQEELKKREEIKAKYALPENIEKFKTDYDTLMPYRTRTNPITGAKLKDAVDASKKSPAYKHFFYKWLKDNNKYDDLFSDNKKATIISELLKQAFKNISL